MFKSLQMTKVELLVAEKDVITVTELLAHSGVFHLLQNTSTPAMSHQNKWQSQAGKLAGIEKRILHVMQELEITEGSMPGEQPHTIDAEVAQRDIERFEREADTPARTLVDLKQRYADLQKYIQQLETFTNLDVTLSELSCMTFLCAIPGFIPTGNIERLRNSLEHIPFTLVIQQHSPTMSTVILFGQNSESDRLMRASRSAYLTPLQTSDEYRGTPSEVISAMQAGLRRTAEHIADYLQEIEHLHEAHTEHLRLLLWRVRASLTLVQIIAGYDRFHNLYSIEGWVPSREVQSLQKKISLINENIEITSKPPGRFESSSVPTATDSPGLLQAFKFLIVNYGQPGYNELDPTWVMAFTFPLVFGVMFGDVGHGLILFAMGLLFASGWVRAFEKLSPLGVVIAFCGAASTVFGFLYGSILGFENVITPLWLQPLSNITSILFAAVFLGVGLLSVGIIYNIINTGLNRHWGDIFFGHNALSGLIFYWSLIGLVAGAFGQSPVSSNSLILSTVISGIGLTFSEPLSRLVDGHRPLIEGSVGTYLMQAFFELFEALIALLSNTLSYVRMGAFAVAHGALSMVVFILADMVDPGHGFGYVLTIILGNLFVIGFEGLIVTIQTLRLEYYEFFSKFFSGNGLEFHPLQLLHERTAGQ
ncbi:MAG: V-type ATPase 116kDa subunit family protein [Anaerolineae bacterium]|nr:V-type ATPase 116kDa subunit family protein [Anaerolineae bacterium]